MANHYENDHAGQASFIARQSETIKNQESKIQEAREQIPTEVTHYDRSFVYRNLGKINTVSGISLIYLGSKIAEAAPTEKMQIVGEGMAFAGGVIILADGYELDKARQSLNAVRKTLLRERSSE